jgi:NADPH:quinone reductase-like Zn-dependent oxidoreductase
MRAVVCDRYGPPDVLRLAEVAKPVPKPDEVLVRVHATTVNRTACGIRAGEPFISRLVSGLRRPLSAGGRDRRDEVRRDEAEDRERRSDCRYIAGR